MALKGDRVLHLTDVGYFKSDAVQERGVILVHQTGGSGAAMDDSLAQVSGVAAYDDEPAGMLISDVVNIDLTRQQYNAHKDENQLGGKVTLLTRGTVVTDQISGIPLIGEKAFFGLDGKLFGLSSAPAGCTGIVVAGERQLTVDQIGRFRSVPDADSFTKVDINIV